MAFLGGRSSIKNLSLALFHEMRADAKFMVLTAYFDESGTHGRDSPKVIVGGFVADHDHWLSYESQTRALFDAYGVDVFHAKQFKDTKGPFKGWGASKKIEFFNAFQHIQNNTSDVGVKAVLRTHDYALYYKNNIFCMKKLQMYCYLITIFTFLL